MIQLNLRVLPDAAKAWAALTKQMFCFTCFSWQPQWPNRPFWYEADECRECYMGRIARLAFEGHWR